MNSTNFNYANSVHDSSQCDNNYGPLPPLFCAAQAGHVDAVLYLVRECKNAVDPFFILKSGKTLLHCFLMTLKNNNNNTRNTTLSPLLSQVFLRFSYT